MRSFALFAMVILSSNAFGLVGRSFGVFSVAYKLGQAQAMGGIGGTAFFISKTKAITAYHVLKPASFQPRPGFDRVKIWLVHENYTAIEITEKNLQYFPNRDETVITLDPNQTVEDKYVFQKDSRLVIGSHVETEGFQVNSTGPVLQFEGQELRVTAVPQLHRLSFSGDLIGALRVNLSATDIDLKDAPCVQLDYQPIVGMSGGPVIADGRVIGMNSFADPSTRAKTWAVTLP